MIVPLLNDGRCIIQDRGLSTTLAYQALDKTILTINDILALSGNHLALEYRPDHLIIVDVTVNNAFSRLNTRAKKDDAIFEKKSFMEKAAQRFLSQEYKEIFENRGTKIHHLNGNSKIDIMKQEATELLKKILQ